MSSLFQRGFFWLAVLAALASGLVAAPSPAENLATFPTGAESFPAVRYASFDGSRCLAELSRRGVSFQNIVGQAPGVLAPVRLTGPLNGVVYRTMLAESARRTTPWEVFDCRLALSP